MDVEEQIRVKTWFDGYHANGSPAAFIERSQVIYALGETGKSDRPLSNEFLLFLFVNTGSSEELNVKFTIVRLFFHQASNEANLIRSAF